SSSPSADAGNGGGDREYVSFEDSFDAELRKEFGDLGPAGEQAPAAGRGGERGRGGRSGGGGRDRGRGGRGR
ncbi:MAG: hypothetical protein QOH64_2887, partial [Acidimicrobiaceae bacterium]